MFHSGILTDSGRKEAEIREAASLRQQRRMKHSVQFMHKDSADLLPLDGLKKLGTSKDTVKYFEKRRDYLKYKEQLEAGKIQPSETT